MTITNERKGIMKRLICVVLALVILLGFCACHIQQNSPGSTDATNDNSGLPPRILSTRSEEAIKEFLVAASLADAEFTEYVAQARADSMALVSAGKIPLINIPSRFNRHDADVLLQIMQAFGLPVLSDRQKLEYFYFAYRPDEPVVYFYYDIDGVRYRFVYNPYNSDEDRVNKATERMWTLGNDKIALYREDDRLVGHLYKTNYMLTVFLKPLAEEKVEKFALETQAVPLVEFGWSNTIGEIE